MKTRLSTLVDGELEQHEEQVLFDALRRGDDPELLARWGEYLLIGDALRQERGLGADITQRVMSSLDHEPVALAPRARARAWHRPLLAVAATLAGVGVVGWMALVQPHSQMTTSVATIAAPEAPAAQPARQQVQTPRDMREYLAAHQAQSGFLQLRDGTENIRTVSATGRAPAK